MINILIGAAVLAFVAGFMWLVSLFPQILLPVILIPLLIGFCAILGNSIREVYKIIKGGHY